MKNFWLGVLVGTIGTLLLCAMLGFTFNFLAMQRTRESFEKGELPPQPPIVLRGFFGSRGEFGVIDDINDKTIMLATREGGKKTVLISSETEIYRGPRKIALSDLSKGQRIMVIASLQEDGRLKAKLIRVVSASMFNFHKNPGDGLHVSPGGCDA